jgi:lysophospholipase L1-like esterase
VSASNNSYFGKAILFIVLSIAIFLLCKQWLPKRLFPENVTATENIVVDSLMLNAINDTTAVNTTVLVPKTGGTDTGAQEEIDETVNPSLDADGYLNLKRFYEKLYRQEETKSGKIRIGYFGDSMNDGDFIVQDVRSRFQKDYGGKGVGYVAISSLSAASRGSISHQVSKDWVIQSFVKVKKPSKPFGIDGQVFFTRKTGSGWVKYKAQSQECSTELYNPVLLYGSSNNQNASVTIRADKDSVFSKKLEPLHLLNTLALTSSDVKSLQVTFNNADSIPIYGFSFDDGQGVHVDNFSMRGNSGLLLSILSPALMNAFDSVLNYDLIILQYGANVLGYGTLNYSWYEKNMTTVVNNLHQCFPNADILIISTADKASKIEQEMKTSLAVIPLAKAQRNYARRTKSGYINLYQVMGGEGSMVKWVDGGLANKDYTHFNAAGSRKVAKLIYDEIDKGFQKYKQDKTESKKE